MGLNLQDGGHLSHGFENNGKKVSATSYYFEPKPYFICSETGLINYDKLEVDAEEFKPNMIIVGYSAYSRDLDYKRFREICDKVGALMLVDMAHYCGLVAAKVLSDPFEYADVVTTTTHKILRGPRGGMIFSKKEFEEKINFSVFPHHQGGPHMNNIAALCYTLKEVASDKYTEYAEQVVKNAKIMVEAMIAKGYEIMTGGTDNHIIIWNVTKCGLTGDKVEAVLEKLLIYTNKNSIAGDKSPMNPGGVRLGTPAVTTRGMLEEEMKAIVDSLEKAITLSKNIQNKSGIKLTDFLSALDSEDFKEEIETYREEVKKLSLRFDVPKSPIE
mmetsp:Transcript_23474/g.26042  ORF Transcript_23474/g.26042 Transcript_23474/m.26042 type:complete len:329 (+) Transcript_23474:384-1370(+)